MRSNTTSTGRLEKNTKMKKSDSTAVSKQTDNTQHINDQIPDPGLKEKVMQLMEIANCTQDNAVLALHDTDSDLNQAAELLLEKNNDMQDGWKEQKTKSKKKPPPQVAAPEQEESTESEVKESSNNREKSYPRNAPPRLQRGRGSRQDGRQGNFTERRYAGGDRGRSRGHGGHRGGGSSRGRDGFSRNRGSNNQSGEQSDLGNTQIGTWTSEADANPKTDSWGEVWNEDDNQWQGDLKGTHVFESTAKTDSFPTPTEFDPSAVAALTTTATATSQSSSINGSNQLNIDAMFPKETVETINRSSISMYDSQRASDSIKSAIGMPTQQQQQLADEVSKNSTLARTQQSYSSQSSSIPTASQSNLVQPLMGNSQSQRQNKQQRSKVPPPSTKIPTAPVEMPHSQTGSMMSLGVQFGAMDFNSDAGSLGIDSSFKPATSVSSATLPQHVGQHSLQGSLYTSGNSPLNTHQSGPSPEPIPYPSQSNQSLSSQDSRSSLQHTVSAASSLYPRSASLKDSQGSHSSYSSTSNVPSQYKSNQSSHSISNTQPGLPVPPADSHASSQSFQSSQTSSSASYYQIQQNLTDKRAGYQSSTSSSAGITASGVNSNQYSSSLYSSSGDQLNVTSSYSHYNSGASLTTSSTAPSSASATPIASTHSPALTSSSNRLSSAKQPPNLPPPGVAQVTAATPMVPVPQSYIVGNTMPYFNQTYYPGPAGVEDMQKYQHAMPSAQFYDMPNQFLPSSSSFPGTATGNAGESKITRIDAQSPTAQGSQSTGNQSQQSAPANTQSHQQQFVSLPPGYHASYAYYPAGMPPYTTGVFQGMSLTGSNAAVYSNQQKGSTSSYYPNTSAYDDNIQSAHSSEYKNSYGSNKAPTNNMTGASGSSTDVSSMYKNVNNSQTAAVAANIYGSPATAAYMPAHPQNHVLTNQHLIQSQMASVAQESNIGGRGTQGGSIPKGHKYYQSTGNWPS